MLVQHPVAESCANTPGKMKNWLSLALKKKRSQFLFFTEFKRKLYVLREWTWIEVLFLTSINLKHFIAIIWVVFHRDWHLIRPNYAFYVVSASFLFNSHFVSIACLSVKVGWNYNSLPDPSHPQLVPVLADLLQGQGSSSHCWFILRCGSATQLYWLTVISFYCSASYLLRLYELRFAVKCQLEHLIWYPRPVCIPLAGFRVALHI